MKSRCLIRNHHDSRVIPAQSILVFNHKSYLDFVINFSVCSFLTTDAGRQVRPRFIAAKNHFLDNPIIYRFFKIGISMEQAGMVFIDRKKGQGFKAMQEAARKRGELDVEISVYPQGTRAKASSSLNGENLDGSYYTTYKASEWDKPLGHIREGTAQLILDTALLTNRSVPVVIIGVNGTSATAPKGANYCITENTITFDIDTVWHYRIDSTQALQKPRSKQALGKAEKNYLAEIERINVELNRRLLKLTDWHAQLRQRFLHDSQEQLALSTSDLATLENHLKIFDTELFPLPYQIIDRLYCLKDKSAKLLALKNLQSLVLKTASQDEYLALLGQVSP